jgi:hypothetical protein
MTPQIKQMALKESPTICWTLCLGPSPQILTAPYEIGTVIISILQTRRGSTETLNNFPKVTQLVRHSYGLKHANSIPNICSEFFKIQTLPGTPKSRQKLIVTNTAHRKTHNLAERSFPKPAL